MNTRVQTRASAVRAVDLDVATTCGPVRDENQDAGQVWRGDEGEVIAIVSDGMGGHTNGRQAAEIVVRSAVDVVRRSLHEPWGVLLRRALEEAHARVLRAEREGPMGATAVLAVLDSLEAPSSLHLAHVGDSRAYLCRGNSIYRLTADHSLVSRLVRDGFLSEDEAFGHPDSNVIHRAIGQEEGFEPEIHDPVPLDDGDWIVLCSDGLHGAVPDRAILDAVRRSISSRDACRTLLRAAIEAGSEDNVTAACLHLPEPTGPARPTRPD